MKRTVLLSTAKKNIYVEILTGSGSSVNLSNRDGFKMLENLMSVTLEKSFDKIYAYGCETHLPILGKVLLIFFELYWQENFRNILCHWHCNIVDSWQICVRFTLCFKCS